jgi:hypothetical protein
MRYTFLTISIALFLLIVGTAPILAEEAKPAAAAPASAATAPTPAVAPAPAVAEEEKPTADFSVSALTKYVWRGYEQTRDGIVVQPSLTVGYKGFSANLWGNLDTRPYSAAPGISYPSTWTETDFTLSYSKTFGPVTAGVGYIYYGLAAPNKDALSPLPAQELFVSVALNKLLTPTLTVYDEIDHYHNWYFLLGVSHTIEFNKVISLKLAASVSYLLSTYADANQFNINSTYGGYPKFDDQYQATNDKFSNFHDGLVSISLPITPAKYITITPTISYTFPLSNDAKNEIKARGIQGTSTPGDRDSSFLYGGLVFDIAF